MYDERKNKNCIFKHSNYSIYLKGLKLNYEMKTDFCIGITRFVLLIVFDEIASFPFANLNRRKNSRLNTEFVAKWIKKLIDIYK